MLLVLIDAAVLPKPNMRRVQLPLRQPEGVLHVRVLVGEVVVEELVRRRLDVHGQHARCHGGTQRDGRPLGGRDRHLLEEACDDLCVRHGGMYICRCVCVYAYWCVLVLAIVAGAAARM